MQTTFTDDLQKSQQLVTTVLRAPHIKALFFDKNYSIVNCTAGLKLHFRKFSGFHKGASIFSIPALIPLQLQTLLTPASSESIHTTFKAKPLLDDDTNPILYDIKITFSKENGVLTGGCIFFENSCTEPQNINWKNNLLNKESGHYMSESVRVLEEFSAILKEDFENGFYEKVKVNFKYFSDNLCRLSNLVSKIRQLQHTGQAPMVYKHFSVEVLLLLVEHQLKMEQFHDFQMSIISELPASLAGDKNQIQIVFFEILKNAITHNSHKDICIEIGCEDLGYGWKITFCDNGTGVAPHLIPTLTAPFSRLHQLKNKSNVGLGLFLADKIIAAHQGTLLIANRPNCGLEVSIVLPKLAGHPI